MQSKKGKVGLIIVLICLGAAVFIGNKRQYIYDQARLYGYQPPESFIQLATDTSMNDKSRNILYVQHPELNDKESFNNNCRFGEQTIVLGCYILNKGIYVYDITDDRLAGVRQVTTAHEMLHAAYDRLNVKERAQVDAMIAAAYEKLDNARIKNVIDLYRKANANISNELHSILGTEVRNLPSDLEAYYKKYFNDRTAVVGYFEKYQQVFTERKVKIDKMDITLSEMKVSIEQAEAELNAENIDITNRRQALDQKFSAGQYSLYNSSVNSFNASIRAYNSKVASTKAQIEEFNRIAEERNAIAIEEQTLYKAIDSRLTTQTNK